MPPWSRPRPSHLLSNPIPRVQRNPKRPAHTASIPPFIRHAAMQSVQYIFAHWFGLLVVHAQMQESPMRSSAFLLGASELLAYCRATKAMNAMFTARVQIDPRKAISSSAPPLFPIDSFLRGPEVAAYMCSRGREARLARWIAMPIFLCMLQARLCIPLKKRKRVMISLAAPHRGGGTLPCLVAS